MTLNGKTGTKRGWLPGKTADPPTTCTNMHLTGLTWESLGKGFGKPEELPTCEIKPPCSAHASTTKDRAVRNHPHYRATLFQIILLNHIPTNYRAATVRDSCHGISVSGPIFTPQETSILLQHSGLWQAVNYTCREEPVMKGYFVAFDRNLRLSNQGTESPDLKAVSTPASCLMHISKFSRF